MAEEVLRYPNNLRPSKEGSALIFGSGDGASAPITPAPAPPAPPALPVLKGGAMSELESIYAESEKLHNEILEQLNKLRSSVGDTEPLPAPPPPLPPALTEDNNNTNESANNDENTDTANQEGGKSRRHRRRHTTQKKGRTGGRKTRRHR